MAVRDRPANSNINANLNQQQLRRQATTYLRRPVRSIHSGPRQIDVDYIMARPPTPYTCFHTCTATRSTHHFLHPATSLSINFHSKRGDQELEFIVCYRDLLFKIFRWRRTQYLSSSCRVTGSRGPLSIPKVLSHINDTQHMNPTQAQMQDLTAKPHLLPCAVPDSPLYRSYKS